MEAAWEGAHRTSAKRGVFTVNLPGVGGLRSGHPPLSFIWSLSQSHGLGIPWSMREAGQRVSPGFVLEELTLGCCSVADSWEGTR